MDWGGIRDKDEAGKAEKAEKMVEVVMGVEGYISCYSFLIHLILSFIKFLCHYYCFHSFKWLLLSLLLSCVMVREEKRSGIK